MFKRKWRRILPKILFSHGSGSDALSGKLTVTQSEPFLLYQMGKSTAMSGSATSSISSGAQGQAVPFRTGVYRCTASKIDVTPYKKLCVLGEYTVTNGSVYGDSHFRRVYIALLSSLSCYVSGSGYYVSHNSSPTADNSVPYVQYACSVGSSGKVRLTIDISDKTGSYYIAAMMLLKACSITGTFNITALWLE